MFLFTRSWSPVVVLLLSTLQSAVSVQTTTPTVLDTVSVWSVTGHRAFLPCDLRPPSRSEQVYLVLWYRGDEGEPIYSYDARHGSWNLGQRWSDQTEFGPRAYFQLSSSPAELRVEDIQESEAGIYRCRVDFKSAPTRNSLVNLTVIAPPSSLNIIDSAGKEVEKSAGPYQEGDRIILRCLSSGEMVFAPVDVSIVTLGEPLSVGKIYLVECEAAGSRPEPVITWWLGDTFVSHNNQLKQKVGNISKSTLTFEPSYQDDGKILTCRAENTQIKDGALQDSWKLSVYYPPIVSLRLGLELGSQAIEESKDVYFECKIKANPEIYKISWTHNGKRIEEKTSRDSSAGGLIISGQSLVLQRVKREQAGNYTCVVSNLEGDAESNSVFLRILYAPRCLRNEKETFGANIGSKLEVKCSVDSYPPPSSFSWGFNNSKDAVKIKSEAYQSGGSSSVLQYSTLSDHHFGHLYCWARNSMGLMSRPCVFNIIPATPPNHPANCAVLNQTTDVLQVRCEPGFDGGLEQSFMLEVIDVNSAVTLANVSSTRPVFIITGLNPGRDLTLMVFAINKNGRSKPTVLEGFTTKVAQLQVETPVPIQFTPFLGILAGAVLGLVLAVVVILLIRYKYKDRDGGETAQRDRELRVCRQTKPDIISPTNQGKISHSGSNNLTTEDNGQSDSNDSELAMISDTNMWIRDKSDSRVLNITMNPSESPGTSWTPLLHNLSTESIL